MEATFTSRLRALEADFNAVCEAVRNCLEARRPSLSANTNPAAAAVMVVLMDAQGVPSVLLTRRAMTLSSHGGEVSLPGGRSHPEDKTAFDTARRETYEETGIRPEHAQYLGRFDDYYAKDDSVVSVFVSSIAWPCQYSFNPPEIESGLEVPLALFSFRENAEEQKYVIDGTERVFRHYRYLGYDVWGLTASILEDLMDCAGIWQITSGCSYKP